MPNAPPPQRLVPAPDTALHTRQSALVTHAVAEFTLHTEPLSHCSPSFFWTILSPHFSILHVLLHPSSSALLPSSHCSAPSTISLPHTQRTELLLLLLLLVGWLNEDVLREDDDELDVGWHLMHGKSGRLTQRVFSPVSAS